MQQSTRNHRFLIIFSTVMLLIMLAALWEGRWSLAFVSFATLALSYVPVIAANRLQIALPIPFLVATAAFLFGSLFLGEELDFYMRVWWWDLALHGTSAIGFGLIGFLFVFMLFEGDRYAAPPWALGLISTCVAITVGSLWEIFEYLMDLIFGLNMQKSGLDDVMSDMMTDAIGGIIGGFSGTLYLVGARSLILVRLLEQFISLNRRLYRKAKFRKRR